MSRETHVLSYICNISLSLSCLFPHPGSQTLFLVSSVAKVSQNGQFSMHKRSSLLLVVLTSRLHGCLHERIHHRHVASMSVRRCRARALWGCSSLCCLFLLSCRSCTGFRAFLRLRWRSNSRLCGFSRRISLCLRPIGRATVVAVAGTVFVLLRRSL